MNEYKRYSLRDLANDYAREQKDKIEPTENDGYFPLMIWNVDKESMDIVKTVADIPAGQAFVVIKTKATGNDFILAERIRLAIEKSKMIEYVKKQSDYEDLG